MKYYQRGKQVSYGEAIGILLIENYVPYIPGDTANATSYEFPVRFERLQGITPSRLFAHDTSMLDVVIKAGRSLVENGVQAITGDCGFLAIYQNEIADTLGVPVFLSSLLQLDFMARIVPPSRSIGIVTASKQALDDELLSRVTHVPPDRLAIAGLDNAPHFADAVFEENGVFDDEIVEEEVLAVTDQIMESGREIGAILLECSLLPPYAAAVQKRTGLPVFDYNTMIRYVHSTVVRTPFSGSM